MDYASLIGGLANTGAQVYGAVAAGDAASTNRQAALLNANAAAAQLNANKTNTANLTKIGIIAGVALLAVVIVVSIFKK